MDRADRDGPAASANGTGFSFLSSTIRPRSDLDQTSITLPRSHGTPSAGYPKGLHTTRVWSNT